MILGKNVFFAAVCASAMVTGCASHPKQSDIIVSPVNSSYPANVSGIDYNYTSGALVTNSPDVVKAAANLASVVYFDFNSSIISQAGKNTLNKQVAFLKQNPTARVLVTGHTDERGSREYNLALGERRAQTVRKYLASQGVNVGSIEIRSLGEEMPAANGRNEEAYRQNRRAVLSY
ncbi:peptidoglycan-associated lipoprotein Pal [Psychrobacter sp. HD31]|uniref:peptidoglycan-associated lipoprotein Pal n=1 Tax=Psychrobacter sp. HD31 TaxID=3112003 RepID=UPI003DA1F218